MIDFSLDMLRIEIELFKKIFNIKSRSNQKPNHTPEYGC